MGKSYIYVYIYFLNDQELKQNYVKENDSEPGAKAIQKLAWMTQDLWNDSRDDWKLVK